MSLLLLTIFGKGLRIQFWTQPPWVYLAAPAIVGQHLLHQADVVVEQAELCHLEKTYKITP